MQFDQKADPYRPLQHLIAQMTEVEQSDVGPVDNANMIVPSSLNILFSAFCRLHPSQTLTTNFGLFLERLRALDCIKSNENDDAPTLHGWSLAQHPTSLCSAVGYTVGHPELRYGSPVVTSVVCRVSEDHCWLRTWNRFYWLEEYDSSTLEAFKVAGLLKRNVSLMSISSSRPA